jgi:hypothetical protein
MDGQIVPGRCPARRDDASGRISEHKVRLGIKPDLGKALAEEIGEGPMRRRFTAFEEPVAASSTEPEQAE